MASGNFVSYLRVSTNKQGAHGLGVEAQRAAVTNYLNGGSWQVIREFVEVESGKNPKRPVLAEALKTARMLRIPLIVAKVDRLTRSLSFLLSVLDSGAEVRFCDLPEIEGPTGRFMLQQMASVAELEAGLIGKRTKDALAQLKVSGKKLGGLRVAQILTDDMRAKGRAKRTAKANSRAQDISDAIAEIQKSGATSLRQIARELDDRQIPTPRGNKSWTATGVSRLLLRLQTMAEI